MYDIDNRMAKRIGGLARLTWGWKESGNGGEAEKLLGTLFGGAVNLTMELLLKSMHLWFLCQ